jgi:hypothetical protein
LAQTENNVAREANVVHHRSQVASGGYLARLRIDAEQDATVVLPAKDQQRRREERFDVLPQRDRSAHLPCLSLDDEQSVPERDGDRIVHGDRALVSVLRILVISELRLPLDRAIGDSDRRESTRAADVDDIVSQQDVADRLLELPLNRKGRKIARIVRQANCPGRFRKRRDTQSDRQTRHDYQ